jgi:nucleotidyltransferase substrate binding protein (TIGR01987 family)
MEKLTLMIKDAEKALKTLDEIFSIKYSTVTRDAAIKRFEYTFEIIWKLVRCYLEEIEGVVVNSPKSCFKQAFKTSLLDEEESILSLEMTDDRNLTSHTYLEDVAEHIYHKIPVYYKLMANIFERINETLKS